MADNNEYQPVYTPVTKFGHYVNSVIKGDTNFIDPSVRNSYISGDGNCIGELCANVTILNSSGCTVTAGVVGSTIINSSGVTVYNDNEVYINNVLLSNSGGLSTGIYYKTTSLSYTIGTNSEEIVESRVTSAGGIYSLPSPVGNNNKYTIKNMSAYDLGVWVYGYTIDDTTSGGAGKVTLTPLDSVTLVSDGVSNYIII